MNTQIHIPGLEIGIVPVFQLMKCSGNAFISSPNGDLYIKTNEKPNGNKPFELWSIDKKISIPKEKTPWVEIPLASGQKILNSLNLVDAITDFFTKRSEEGGVPQKSKDTREIICVISEKKLELYEL